MTLTQTLRGMAQYLSATADPIDRERWAMTLRDTADALATAQVERDEWKENSNHLGDRFNLLTAERDAARQEAEASHTERRGVLGLVRAELEGSVHTHTRLLHLAKQLLSALADMHPER